jgi:hypothetical protein
MKIPALLAILLLFMLPLAAAQEEDEWLPTAEVIFCPGPDCFIHWMDLDAVDEDSVAVAYHTYSGGSCIGVYDIYGEEELSPVCNPGYDNRVLISILDSDSVVMGYMAAGYPHYASYTVINVADGSTELPLTEIGWSHPYQYGAVEAIDEDSVFLMRSNFFSVWNSNGLQESLGSFYSLPFGPASGITLIGDPPQKFLLTHIGGLATREARFYVYDIYSGGFNAEPVVGPVTYSDEIPNGYGLYRTEALMLDEDSFLLFYSVYNVYGYPPETATGAYFTVYNIETGEQEVPVTRLTDDGTMLDLQLYTSFAMVDEDSFVAVFLNSTDWESGAEDDYFGEIAVYNINTGEPERKAVFYEGTHTQHFSIVPVGDYLAIQFYAGGANGDGILLVYPKPGTSEPPEPPEPPEPSDPGNAVCEFLNSELSINTGQFVDTQVRYRNLPGTVTGSAECSGASAGGSMSCSGEYCGFTCGTYDEDGSYELRASLTNGTATAECRAELAVYEFGTGNIPEYPVPILFLVVLPLALFFAMRTTKL